MEGERKRDVFKIIIWHNNSHNPFCFLISILLTSVIWPNCAKYGRLLAVFFFFFFFLKPLH